MTRYDRSKFAANLCRLMEEEGLRQADLARFLQVSRATVSSYCKGEQMPRMDKLEALSKKFGVSFSQLVDIEETGESAHIAVETYERLNEAGQLEFIRYGTELALHSRYSASAPSVTYIKHYMTAAAAGYAAPIEGQHYELIPLPADAPTGADFCISIDGDSMEPYIKNGSLVYVRRDSPLEEFDVGVFFVDGDVFCKQWCTDYSGTLHLLSANPDRQDANIVISPDSGRSCVCFGKVLLEEKLSRPRYI